MTRGYRILTAVNSSVTAEAPEAVNVESDFVVILAALLCALICVVGLIAVARCAWLRRGGGGDGGDAPNGRRSSHQSSAKKGLKKKFVEALPKYTYDSAKDAKLTGDCAICLAEYVNGDEIRVLPQCGHGFHVGCIDTWLGSHASCPSCRQILVVTRCKKCGEFPTVSTGTGDATTEVEAKGRQDSGSSSGYLP